MDLWNSYRLGCALQFCYYEDGGFLEASVKFKPLLIVSHDNGFISVPLGLSSTLTLDDVLWSNRIAADVVGWLQYMVIWISLFEENMPVYLGETISMKVV